MISLAGVVERTKPWVFVLVMISGLVAGCASGSSSSGVCGNGRLDNGEECDDGNTLPGDGCSSDCRWESTAESNCYDGVDDDGDELTDCADDDCDQEICGVNGRRCQAHQCVCPGGDGPETACDNDEDDDCDGLSDCRDPDCAGDTACSGNRETVCNDGLDNDEDGQTDCADSDCGQDPACAETEDICNDGQDNDGDQLPDCQDRDCEGQTCGPNGLICIELQCACPSGQTVETVCDDGLDNDCDGSSDCHDIDCAAHPSCATTEGVCNDSVDNDNDGQTDCADGDCVGQPCGANGRVCSSGVCQCPGGTVETICNDGQDNDCDGSTDCGDSDCLTNPICVGTETVCNDSVDNDNDGQTDCVDGDCVGQPCGANGRVCSGGLCQCPGGTTETVCNDSVDNDCDGLTDCADSNCASNPACVETVCNDTTDNDNDGLTDCADGDCAGRTCGSYGRVCIANVCQCPGGSTESVCNDGQDNDCDGLTDCSDPNCDSSPACTPNESICDDGVDNDNDGQTDCADTDCAASPPCTGPICDINNLLFCNVNHDGTTAGYTNNVQGYSCSSLVESGPEFVYEIIATTNVTMTASLTEQTVDLDLFLLDGSTPICDPDNCLAYSATTGDETIVRNPAAGAWYYFVVDAVNASSGSYNFAVTCTGGSSCSASWLMGCGDTDDWGTTGADSTNNVDSYNCTSWTEDGPEYTYVFAPGANGTATITMTPDLEDLDLFVLSWNNGACDANQCLHSSTNAGTEEISFSVSENDLYLVVVDGYDGASDTYYISFSCN